MFQKTLIIDLWLFSRSNSPAQRGRGQKRGQDAKAAAGRSSQNQKATKSVVSATGAGGGSKALPGRGVPDLTLKKANIAGVKKRFVFISVFITRFLIYLDFLNLFIWFRSRSNSSASSYSSSASASSDEDGSKDASEESTSESESDSDANEDEDLRKPSKKTVKSSVILIYSLINMIIRHSFINTLFRLGLNDLQLRIAKRQVMLKSRKWAIHHRGRKTRNSSLKINWNY